MNLKPQAAGATAWRTRRSSDEIFILTTTELILEVGFLNSDFRVDVLQAVEVAFVHPKIRLSLFFLISVWQPSNDANPRSSGERRTVRFTYCPT
jgi:hypothetical protein